jgi:heat shock protein HslJ
MYKIGIFLFFLLFTSLGVAADRYLHIITPAAQDLVEPGQPLLVSGTGRGLFEGNVVVRIENASGEQLLQVPTTMKLDDIAAEGEWQISVTLPQPLPDTLVLSAFSPSPKEGDAAIRSGSIMLKTRSAPGLEGPGWKLGHYRDASGQLMPVLQDTRVTAHFMDGKLSGSAGCNRYFGTYSTGSGDQLSLATNIGMTMMACAPPVSDQERQYLDLLATVAGFQWTDHSLQLFDQQHLTVLEYTAIKPLTLENTPWQAAGINNGKGGVVSTASTGLSTAYFKDGRISGHAGCNTFNASYETTGDQISIGPVMSTRKHCAEPDGIMEQEQEYLQALSQARVYELTDVGLKLRDDDGSLQVNFLQVTQSPGD